MDDFKNRLVYAMDCRNIKQTDLCRITRIPKSAISQYISGSFKPKADRTYILAKALDVNEAWLMGYDVSMERNDTSSEQTNKPADNSRLNNLVSMISNLNEAQLEAIENLIYSFLDKGKG